MMHHRINNEDMCILQKSI